MAKSKRWQKKNDYHLRRKFSLLLGMLLALVTIMRQVIVYGFVRRMEKEQSFLISVFGDTRFVDHNRDQRARSAKSR